MVACAAAGFRPRVAHEVDRTHVAVGLVACGLGLCFVPSSAELASYPGVAYRPLSAPSPRLTFGAIWDQDAATPLMRNFLSLEPWKGARNELHDRLPEPLALRPLQGNARKVSAAHRVGGRTVCQGLPGMRR